MWRSSDAPCACRALLASYAILHSAQHVNARKADGGVDVEGDADSKREVRER